MRRLLSRPVGLDSGTARVYPVLLAGDVGGGGIVRSDHHLSLHVETTEGNVVGVCLQGFLPIMYFLLTFSL